MSEILVLSRVQDNAWPEEFSGSWGNIMKSYLGNIVFSLYFNNNYEEGTINRNNDYLELPDAYISISPEGTINEIYVIPSLRRNKIGFMLCAWTRTNFLNDGIIVKAPKYMTDSAKELYAYISNEYGEPYDIIGPAPIFDVYLDFGGRSILDIEKKYTQGG
jgi:GNAT superfamily N-acetyltransferase